MIFNSYLMTNYYPIHFQDLQGISINLLDKCSIKNVEILAVWRYIWNELPSMMILPQGIYTQQFMKN